MGKTNKVVLKHYLTSDIQEYQPAPNKMFVLGGGVLLRWFPKRTYKDVVVKYLRYVKNKFELSSIVFDGYKAGLCIMDHKHQRGTTLIKSVSENVMQFPGS